MPTPLTCAQLQTAVTDDVTDFQPPVLQLALNLFASAGFFTQFTTGTGGFVYAGNYGGSAPNVTPASGKGGVGIDSVSRRQWQYSAGWT